MKRTGILIGWLVWTAGVSAQSWSLDDCMKYAVEHATEVKREVVNARQRKKDYQQAVAGFLTTVTGGVQGQYAWGRNIDPETNTYKNVTTFNNYYQLYAELNVFDGFATINALKQAKLSRDYSATAMQKILDDRAIDVMQKYVDAAYAEESIQIASEKLNESNKLSRDYSATAMQKILDDRAIDVMQKYVDAAYAEESIQIASEKLNESKRMLAKMKRLYELGEKGRPDVVQMESQVAEDEYNLTHQENVAKQSLLALKSLNESKRMLAKMKRLYELGEKGRPDVVQMESQVAEDEYNLTHQENVAKQSLLALKSAMNFQVDEVLNILIKEEQNL